MVNNDYPCTYENWPDAWVEGRRGERDTIIIDGEKVTAAYLWSLNAEQRIECLHKVFNYYRSNGFPYERYDDKHIMKQYKELVKTDPNNVVLSGNVLSNYGRTCLDVCRHFCWDKFWKASGETTMSIEDAFNDDNILMSVLKNRMGWNTTGEGGEEKPYMFSISDNMIRTGIRNSGYGYGVSNFRPLIAKFIYTKYLAPGSKVFDYSGGWGARALAAASCGMHYYATDPLTADNINEIGDFLRSNAGLTTDLRCIKSGSEVTEVYDSLPMVDMCMSCPPYFKLEVYDSSDTQSYNKYDEFKAWIDEYWDKTVSNCCRILKPGGWFVLIIKDKYKSFTLKDSMDACIKMHGLELVDTYTYKTSKSHLTKKAASTDKTKSSEFVLVYQMPCN